MAVLWSILAFVILLPVVAIGLCVGAVLLVAPRKPKPAPAPKPRNVSGPPPAAARPQPMPDIIRRWNTARRLQSVDDKTAWMNAFNDLAGPPEPPKDPFEKLAEKLGSL